MAFVTSYEKRFTKIAKPRRNTKLTQLELFIVIFYDHLFGNKMSSSIGALNGIEFLSERLQSSYKNSRLTRLKD